MANNPASRDSIAYLTAGMDLVPVTPNDSTDLATAARSIRCKPNTGVAGNVAFVALNGQSRTTEIAVGETLAVGAKRILSTGTTATGLEIYI